MSTAFTEGFLDAQDGLEKGATDTPTKLMGAGALAGLPIGVASGYKVLHPKGRGKKFLTRKGYLKAVKKMKGRTAYKALAAVGLLSFLSGIGATVKLREAAAAKHGKGWKEKIKGKPGSFTPRHPIIANLIGGVPGVSALRAED